VVYVSDRFGARQHRANTRGRDLSCPTSKSHTDMPLMRSVLLLLIILLIFYYPRDSFPDGHHSALWREK
jgi:hypothetical protein